MLQQLQTQTFYVIRVNKWAVEITYRHTAPPGCNLSSIIAMKRALPQVMIPACTVPIVWPTGLVNNGLCNGIAHTAVLPYKKNDNEKTKQ